MVDVERNGIGADRSWKVLTVSFRFLPEQIKSVGENRDILKTLERPYQKFYFADNDDLWQSAKPNRQSEMLIIMNGYLLVK